MSFLFIVYKKTQWHKRHPSQPLFFLPSFCRVSSGAAFSRISTTRCVWRMKTVSSCAWTVTGASTAASRSVSPWACPEMVRDHVIAWRYLDISKFRWIYSHQYFTNKRVKQRIILIRFVQDAKTKSKFISVTTHNKSILPLSKPLALLLIKKLNFLLISFPLFPPLVFVLLCLPFSLRCSLINGKRSWRVPVVISHVETVKNTSLF